MTKPDLRIIMGVVERQKHYLGQEYEHFSIDNPDMPPSKAFRDFMFLKIAQIQIELLKAGARKE